MGKATYGAECHKVANKFEAAGGADHCTTLLHAAGDMVDTLRRQLEEAKEAINDVAEDRRKANKEVNKAYKCIVALRDEKDEAERLLRLTGARTCAEPTGDQSLTFLREGHSPELADISIAVDHAMQRLQAENASHQQDYDDCGDLLAESVSRNADLQAELDVLRGGADFETWHRVEMDWDGNEQWYWRMRGGWQGPYRNEHDADEAAHTALAQREPKPGEN